MTIDYQLIQSCITTNARPLDLALYNFYFNGGTQEAVREALAAYQNEDGGFGRGIEPDFQLPDSSALGTTLAFQYLAKLGNLGDTDLVRRGITYLLQTYDHQKNGWNIVPREVNTYPHAPWWDYERSQQGFGWGNPGAEVVGYLLQYRALVQDTALVETVTQRALERLHELVEQEDPDFHELLCYIRLYQLADQQLQTQLCQLLADLISKVVNTNPRQWGSYVATPLTFVKTPDSTFITLFDSKLIEANLDYLKQSIVNGDHWGPTWDWGGDYPEAWNQAKQAWSGKLTVENLLVLKAFEGYRSA